MVDDILQRAQAHGEVGPVDGLAGQADAELPTLLKVADFADGVDLLQEEGVDWTIMLPRTWVCLIAVLACVVLAMTYPAATVSTWIDPVSGSVKFETSWLSIPTRTRIETSELERWIVAHEGCHNPQWHFLNENYRLISGRFAGCGVGLTPKIFPIHAGDSNTRFVHVATDAEIAEFVRVMRQGTRDEQAQAVDEAAKILESGYGSPRAAPAGPS